MEDAISDAIEVITDCSVCRKKITKAVSLPCVHAFCADCLGAVQVGTVTCPVCSKVYPIEEVRKNRFVQELIDECLSLGSSTKSICSFCAEDDLESKSEFETQFEAEPGTLATMHCLDCRRNLCPECCRGHRRHCKNHVIVDLEDDLLKRRSISRSVPRCNRHQEENLKIFCFDCRSVLCVLCYADSHNSHTCKDVANVASEFQRQLRENSTWLDVCSAGFSSDLTDIEQEWRSLEESVRETRSKIREKGEQMKRMVDVHMTRLTKQMDSLSQKKFQDFDSSRKAIQNQLLDIEYLKKYILSLTENGSPCHIVDCFHRLIARAAELNGERPDVAGTTNQVLQVVFSKPDPVELVSGETEKLIGRVSIVEVYDSVEKNEHQDNEEQTFSKLLGTIETEGRGVMGVTMLNNKLYIVCAWTNIISVHSAEHPFGKNTSILVKDMRCPNDITSCVDSSCMYIVDSELSCVWRVSTSGQADRWVSKAGQPWTISVNRGRVVLAADSKPPYLNIYGPGGGILQRVKLPSSVSSVQHAIELKNGNFVVCQGKNSDHANRICEISKTGSMLRGFDGISDTARSSPGFPLVKYPKHVAIDAENRVFVADFSNHYVLLLNNRLELDRVLLSWEQDRVDGPCRLCYVPGTGCLVLAETASVKVYDIQGLRAKTLSPNGTAKLKPSLFDATKM